MQKKPEVLKYMEFEWALSETDKKYFNAIASSTSVKQAAGKLGIIPQTLYNWKYDLLNRRIPRMIAFLQCVSLQKFRTKVLRKFLTQRVEISFDEQLERISKIEKLGLSENLDQIE